MLFMARIQMEQRVRGIGCAQVAVAATFDDEPQIVLACEIDHRNHVGGAFGGNCVDARC
jgi:hypothetical protein